MLDEEEKKFHTYAEQAIKEWKENGKNVKPLIIELKNIKKRSVL